MDEKRQHFIDTLSRFVPAHFAPYLTDCILNANIQFKIVPGRKTKLGDFRTSPLQKKPIITVNGDLNPYSFLITSLHELAHLDTYRKHGWRVAAHGAEWKAAFRDRLLPVLESETLPADLQKVLWKSWTQLKASSGTDLHLSRALKAYDKKEETHTLESLPLHAEFLLNQKCFKKGQLRRTRYLCTEIGSNKQYLVHALAAVTPIEHDTK